jgi:hypothetical protein
MISIPNVVVVRVEGDALILEQYMDLLPGVGREEQCALLFAQIQYSLMQEFPGQYRFEITEGGYRAKAKAR